MTDFAAIAALAAAASPMATGVPLVPGRRVHVDGDMLAYMAGGNAETSVAASRAMLRNKVEKFQLMSGAESALLHLTASGSLKGDRVLVAQYQPYQDNRAKTKQAKPKNWAALREMMEQGTAGKVKLWDDREADDGFGYVSKHCPNDVVATQDKDMQRLYGWHIDWVTYELFYVPPGTYEMMRGEKMFGDKWFLHQMLQGDKADHIPGLVKHIEGHQGKVGPKTADKFLKGTTCIAEGLEQVIRRYKETWGSTWATLFAENAALLWIRTGKESYVGEWYQEWAYHFPAQEDQQALQQAVLNQTARINAMKQEAYAEAA